MGNWAKNCYRESQTFEVWQAHSHTNLVKVTPPSLRHVGGCLYAPSEVELFWNLVLRLHQAKVVIKFILLFWWWPRINSESAVYTYSTNSEFEFKNWSSISQMYTVKDCTSRLMNMNLTTTPVYNAEKV